MGWSVVGFLNYAATRCPLFPRRYSLKPIRNGKIEGALLTTTKLYAGGHTEKLEGVFINRTSFESPTDKGLTTFGLGTLGRPIEVSDLTLDKLFYELKSQ